MKKDITLCRLKKVVGLPAILFIVFMVSNCAQTIAESVKDTSVSHFIAEYFSKNTNDLNLYYPKTVQRFYGLANGNAAWVREESNPKQTWEAMMFLDCVLQYGLAHEDYHPKELLYEPLHTMLEEPGKVGNRQKARFDILLSDALITLMNNLHYGKLNPVYTSDKVDAGGMIPFHAENALFNARQQDDFMSAISKVQPKSKIYANMQDHMRKLKGVYQGDCYDIPESEVRKIAINMERIRWEEVDGDTYIQINIPAYTLKFIRADSVYDFKVIVGKPHAPTPTLSSNISYLTTYPEPKIPRKIFINELLPKAIANPLYLVNNHYSIYSKDGQYLKPTKTLLLKAKRNPDSYYALQYAGCDNELGQIVFRFANAYGVNLHDTPEQNLFGSEQRALSNYCIRVERAKQLAELLLKTGNSANKISVLDNALKKHLTRNVSLKIPVPVKITYLTCIIKKGDVITFKDIYNLDKSLEMALYNTNQTLTIK
jgi:murein L,D-transpeptidase YcbB/YkuD